MPLDKNNKTNKQNSKILDSTDQNTQKNKQRQNKVTTAHKKNVSIVCQHYTHRSTTTKQKRSQINNNFKKNIATHSKKTNKLKAK